MKMCAFCAAIPATLAIGANTNAKQIRKRRESEARDETLPKTKEIPAAKVTAIAVGILVLASVVYHSRLNI